MTSSRNNWLFLICATLVTGAAQAEPIVLPDLGSAGLGTISSAEEAAIGRNIIAQLHDAGLIVDDPELTDYIRDVGFRLVGAADTRGQSFNFYIIRDDAVNAFALPGGHIGINTGLIRRTESESELASVLAHEIAHVTQRHVARRIEESSSLGLKSLAALLGAIAVAAAGGTGDQVSGAIMLGQGLVAQEQINFTRGQEYEADRVGIDILAHADFDPNGMVSFFETMQRMQRLQGIRMPEYFSTHPLGTSRVVEATQRARSIDANKGRESRMYPLIKARLRVLADSSGTAPGSIPDNADTVTRYHAALELLQYGDARQAIPLFEALVAKDDSLIPYHLGLARAYAAANRQEDAMTVINEAIRLFPESLPVGMTFARLTRDLGDPARGLRHLRRLFDIREPEPAAMRLMAQLASDAGETAESHFYLSEYYLQQGDLSSARLQLQLAVDTADIGSASKRQYQARLDEISEVLALRRAQERRQPRSSGGGRG
jgi:predicted Zn-dependent protease